MPRDAAHQRRGDGDAHRGGGEVVDRQRHHLREIGHRGFAAVALPVGVGGEADGGVERQVRRLSAASPCGFSGSRCLQPQNRVGEQTTHQAEEQHARCIASNRAPCRDRRP